MTIWSRQDDGILRPFSYIVNCVCHDGTFAQRRETIFVLSEKIGFKLISDWNRESSLKTNQLPKYEYRKA